MARRLDYPQKSLDHTAGPLDGSLYATVAPKGSPNSPSQVPQNQQQPFPRNGQSGGRSVGGRQNSDPQQQYPGAGARSGAKADAGGIRCIPVELGQMPNPGPRQQRQPPMNTTDAYDLERLLQELSSVASSSSPSTRQQPKRISGQQSYIEPLSATSLKSGVFSSTSSSQLVPQEFIPSPRTSQQMNSAPRSTSAQASPVYPSRSVDQQATSTSSRDKALHQGMAGREVLGYESDTAATRAVNSSWLAQQQRRLQKTRFLLTEKEQRLIEELKNFHSQTRRGRGTRSATSTPTMGILGDTDTAYNFDRQVSRGPGWDRVRTYSESFQEDALGRRKAASEVDFPTRYSSLNKASSLSYDIENRRADTELENLDAPRLRRRHTITTRGSGTGRFGAKGYSLDQSDISTSGTNGISRGSRVHRSYSLDRGQGPAYAEAAQQYLNGSRSLQSGDYEESPSYRWQQEMQQQAQHQTQSFAPPKRDTGIPGLSSTDTKLAELERSLQQASERISRSSNLNNYLAQPEAFTRHGPTFSTSRSQASPMYQTSMQSRPTMTQQENKNVQPMQDSGDVDLVSLQPIGRGVQDLRQLQGGARPSENLIAPPKPALRLDTARSMTPTEFYNNTYKEDSSTHRGSRTNHDSRPISQQIYPTSQTVVMRNASAQQRFNTTSGQQQQSPAYQSQSTTSWSSEQAPYPGQRITPNAVDSPQQQRSSQHQQSPAYHPQSTTSWSSDQAPYPGHRITSNSIDSPQQQRSSQQQQQQQPPAYHPQSTTSWSSEQAPYSGQRITSNSVDSPQQQRFSQQQQRMGPGQWNSSKQPLQEETSTMYQSIPMQLHSNGPLDSPAQSPASGPSHKVLRSPISPTESPFPVPSSASYRTSGEPDDPDGLPPVNQTTLKFVGDTSKFWYRPTISRDEAITFLKDKPPGSFLVRDSSSFPNHFGLAVRVDKLPEGVRPKSEEGEGQVYVNLEDLESELIRHFLIEKTAKGVRIRSCANERFFGSLASLIYQHTLTPLALPNRLILPDVPPQTPDLNRVSIQSPSFVRRSGEVPTNQDLSVNTEDHEITNEILLQGAVCKVLYLGSVDIESLTGAMAINRAVDILLSNVSVVKQTEASFKAAADGITLTDNWRKLFFRRHYPLQTISYCGLDPRERGWDSPEIRARGMQKARMFGFVARKQNVHENTCHLFSEADPIEPAGAVVDFVTRYLLGRRF